MYRVVESYIKCDGDDKFYRNFADGSNWVPFPMEGVCCVSISNRGVIEFIEVLKLDVAFLYDLLGASQEHKIKPKKFALTDIDEVIIGHINFNSSIP
jgi:predicted Ser/Thr protein kinase